MTTKTRVTALPLAAILIFTAGCEMSSFPNSAPATLEEVDAVRDDADLTTSQNWAELARMGVDESTINAVLADERTGNQYGGDLESAYDKVSGSRLNTLTPDEVQIYADAASEEDSDFSFDITDEEAASTVILFLQNGIDSSDALSDFLSDTSKEVPSDIPEDFLENVFLDFDPDLLLPLLP